jgi:alginate O-acetyltransferase complex protein AlgI
LEDILFQIQKIFEKFDIGNLLRDIFLYSQDAAPLIFTRLYFWGFFALVLLFYSFLYKKNFVRNFYLFFVSAFFYYKTSGIFVLLLLFTIFSSFMAVIAVTKANKKFWRKCWLTLGVFITLLLLAYYKYTYMLVEWFNAFFNTHVEVENVLGTLSNSFFGTHFDTARIFLPVGISFFSFHAISYMVDVYRKKLEPVKSFSDYGFYITFFPQLFAGPIVRASEFIPQMQREYNLSKDEFGYAVYMIMKGLVKKIIFADFIASNFIDRIFDNPLAYSGFENYMALIGYSLQVYSDFSGYTDIAIGTAQLLGFKIPTNFNSPYKALNVGDFWKRWHISLSSWLRDYLYIPLGGNRKGKFRTEVNLMITMLLGGLWHGADIKFIIWGGLNGLGIATYKLWRKISFYENSRLWIATVWKIAFTFAFITFTRIFFRSANMDIVGAMFTQLGKGIEWDLVPAISSSYKLVFILILIGFVFHWLSSSFKEFFRGLFIKAHWTVKMTICLIVILIVYQSLSAEMQPFIYFQF